MTDAKREGAQRVGAAAGVALVLGVVIALLVFDRGGWGHKGSDRPTSGFSGVPMGGVSPVPLPLRCGKGAAPHEYASVLDTPLANDSNMTYSVWCDTGLVEGFSSGVRIVMSPWYEQFPGDSTQMLKGLAAEYPPSTKMGTVQGVPALEYDYNSSDSPKMDGSLVLFIKNGVYVTLIGDPAPLSSLLDIADVIKPVIPSPAPQSSSG